MKIVRKLRTKFIAIATVSVFVLLLAILASVNISNFALVASDADIVTQTIKDSGGKLPDPSAVEPSSPGGAADPGRDQPGGPQSEETLASIRYFTYAYDDEGNGTQIALNMTLVHDEEALAWGRGLVDASETGWTRTYYRYRTYTLDSLTYVSVIDESRELAPSYRVLYASIIGSSVGIVVAFLAIFFISKWVFKPLEESQRKQKRFISNASHELKTPISIISAESEILEIVSGESESTAVIKKQVKRLNEMVKDLNALARIDEMEKAVSLPFSLSEAAIEIANSFKPAFERRGISYSFDIQEGISYQGDEAMIRQVISVMLDNASKYAKQEAFFFLKAENGRIVILERNDAEGLSDGPLDECFERFYRRDEDRASGVEGSGIGLSLAKEAIDIHHGRIRAYAEGGYFVIKAEL